MDVSKSRFKTASNGSLHSTYASYGSHLPPSTSVPRGQKPRQRRALRNASLNSILPPSPGPLTSMLKTTTETGDISVFSIQPSVTPAAYHQHPRARPDMLEGTTPPKYTPRKGENFYYADDHRHFRSYRDTTSEIISLYGYDNQAFYMTPGSPMFDDISHRSYSITTNSSRQLPSQKSSGTLQSQSSRSGLQRPRSPFPYPTRLKRPGVRPASPALAENGCIDYSRMIELDRVSQVQLTYLGTKPWGMETNDAYREPFMGLTIQHITTGREGHLLCLFGRTSIDPRHRCPQEHPRGRTTQGPCLTGLEPQAPRNLAQADMDDLRGMRECLLIVAEDPLV